MSRCTVATTFENLLLTAFDQLDVFYLSTASLKTSSSVKGTVEQSYLAIKASIEATASTENQITVNRLLPPQLTPQKLAELCGAAGCCWVLEDFHKVPISEKTKISQIMKVFTDTAIQYPLTKIVAVGAVHTARQVIEYDNEMRTRVAEIEVPMMTSQELVFILKKGEQLLNIRFGGHKDEIARYSSGLGAICHQIALNICVSAGVESTCLKETWFKNEDFRGALQRYLDNSSDTLKSVFDKATKRERGGKFDNTRLILKAITLLGQDGATYGEILKKIQQEAKGYPSGNLTTYLKDLQGAKRATILRFDPASGKYFFSDPLYFAFAQCQFVPMRESQVMEIRILGERFNMESYNVGEIRRWVSSASTKAGHVFRTIDKKKTTESQ